MPKPAFLWPQKASKQPYTMTPNIFFEIANKMTAFEWTVLGHILRRIYGWHKDEDAVSMGQISEATGLSRSTVKRALKNLEEDGWIVVIRSSIPSARKPGKSEPGINVYRLLIEGEQEAKGTDPKADRELGSIGPYTRTQANSDVGPIRPLQKKLSTKESKSSSSAESVKPNEEEEAVVAAVSKWTVGTPGVARKLLAMAREFEPGMPVKDVVLGISLSVPQGNYRVRSAGYFLTALPGVLRSPAFAEMRALPAGVAAEAVPEPPAELGNSEWDRVRKAMRDTIHPVSYANWFGRTQQESFSEGVLVVGVPDEPTRECLASEYGAAIRDALTGLGTQVEAIAFRIRERV